MRRLRGGRSEFRARVIRKGSMCEMRYGSEASAERQGLKALCYWEPGFGNTFPVCVQIQKRCDRVDGIPAWETIREIQWTPEVQKQFGRK